MSGQYKDEFDELHQDLEYWERVKERTFNGRRRILGACLVEIRTVLFNSFADPIKAVIKALKRQK